MIPLTTPPPVAVRRTHDGVRVQVVAETGSPGPDELVVRMHTAGLCGTDLHVAAGHFDGRVLPGTVLGHEGSGVVLAAGDAVEEHAVGDPVVVHPVLGCGTCTSCHADAAHVCSAVHVHGLDLDGCLQSRWTVPAACVLPLPADLDLRAAALVEPLAVAVHDVRRAAVTAADRVLVVGAGPVGLLAALVARDAGADVSVAETNPARAARVRDLGLPDAAPGAEHDVVLEVSGTAGGLAAAVAATAPRARLVVVGIHAEPRAVDVRRIYSHELSVLGARLHHRDDFVVAIDLLHRGVVRPEHVVAEVVTPHDVPAAIARIGRGEVPGKVLVDLWTTSSPHPQEHPA